MGGESLGRLVLDLARSVLVLALPEPPAAFVVHGPGVCEGSLVRGRSIMVSCMVLDSLVLVGMAMSPFVGHCTISSTMMSES